MNGDRQAVDGDGQFEPLDPLLFQFVDFLLGNRARGIPDVALPQRKLLVAAARSRTTDADLVLRALLELDGDRLRNQVDRAGAFDVDECLFGCRLSPVDADGCRTIDWCCFNNGCRRLHATVESHQA